MGGYEEIFASEETTEEILSPEEAITAIALIAAYADDEDNELEKEAIAELLFNLDEFSDYSEDEVIDTLARIETLADEYGLGPLFNTALESLNDESVSTAFAAAVFVLIVDGEIPEDEEDFLYELQQSLGLSEGEADDIISEVIESFEIEVE